MSKTLGRPIPAREEARQALITLATRPQRIAFLIAKDFDFEELLRVIRYNTTVWGGILNLLVPTDGETLSEGWWRTIEVHSPDVVVSCGAIGESLAEEVHRRLQPLLLRSWQGVLVDEPRIDRLNGVRMMPVLADAVETRGAEDLGQLVRVPDVSPDHPFFPYATPQFGVLDDVYREIYTQQLKAPVRDLDKSTDFASYLETASSILDRRTPLQLTRVQIAPIIHWFTPAANSRVILCLAGDDYIEELCTFWTVRMAPRFGPAHTLFLPIEPLASSTNLGHLAQWCNRRLAGTNFMVVASSSIGSEQLWGFRFRLRRLLRDDIDFIDLWVSHFTMGRFEDAHKEQRYEVTWQGDRTRVKRPVPAFDNQYLKSSANWILDLDLADPLRRQQGFIPPDFPDLNYILNRRPDKRWLGVTGYSMRKNYDVLSIRVNKKQSTEFVEVVLPSEEEVFTEFLTAYGYQSELTDKCRYVTGMTQLLTQAGALDFLRQSLFRRLLEGLAQKRKSFSLYEIQGWLHCPEKRKDDLRNWLADLSRDALLLRGYRLRCPECNLEAWYALSDASEVVSCAGCLTDFQMPLNAEFSYRLNRLVQLGMEQGAIPVILTRMLLQDLSRKSFLHLPGMKVKKVDEEVDLDILASCDGHAIVVECKDLAGGCGEEAATEIADQLERTYAVSAEIGADIVFLSMMADEDHPELARLVEEMDQQDGPSVHLLLLEDLERGHPTKDTPSLHDPGRTGEPGKASLSDLLPKKSADQGWIKEKGQRRVSF